MFISAFDVFLAFVLFLFLLGRSDRRRTYAYWPGWGRRRTDDNPANDDGEGGA